MSDPISRRGLFGFLPKPPVDYDAVTEHVRATFDAGGHAPLYRALEPVAPLLVDAAAAAPGAWVLDVGAGDGNVALAFSAAGAAVDACDLSPRTVMAGLERTGQTVRWSQGDVQVLPYDDEGFDVVVSAFGAALAPRPNRTARELARVLRPGGTLVLAAWAPESLPGALDAHVAWPRGIAAPSDWGRSEVVYERLEPHFDDVVARLHTVELPFADEQAAFAALAGPYGLPEDDRDGLKPRFDALLRQWDDGALAARCLVVTARRPD